MRQSRSKQSSKADRKLVVAVPKIPLLSQNSARMFQKLINLKQKISQQKTSRVTQKGNLSKPESEELRIFLQKIDLQRYESKLIDNGVYTLEVLKQAKQSELEEIGIAKGHALKIIVACQKIEHCREKIEERCQKTHVKVERATTAQTVASSCQNNSKIQVVSSYQGCQTEGNLFDQVSTLYCLFCYKRSKQSFCSASCQTHYQKMFSTYEQNLLRAEQQFQQGKQETVSEQIVQQVLASLDFLDVQADQDADQEEYNHAMDLLNGE